MCEHASPDSRLNRYSDEHAGMAICAPNDDVASIVLLISCCDPLRGLLEDYLRSVCYPNVRTCCEKVGAKAKSWLMGRSFCSLSPIDTSAGDAFSTVRSAQVHWELATSVVDDRSSSITGRDADKLAISVD